MNIFKHKSSTGCNSLHFVRNKHFEPSGQLYRPNHFHILISHLAEFQKGQCIFWLAIAAAVFVGLAGSAETLGMSNLASFYANIDTLQMICICGYIYTTIGLYCLHLVAHREWYIFSMSFVATGFSGSAWAASFYIQPTEITPLINDKNLDKCGHFNP